ncbi:cysteine-rich perinuclear theca protein 1-like [Rattus norvegicus]|nr:cysteine-rich perinuclear theca protein 1-like [Rattus norvegicus]
MVRVAKKAPKRGAAAAAAAAERSKQKRKSKTSSHQRSKFSNLTQCTCRRRSETTFFQITEKGEKSLRPATGTKSKKKVKSRIHKEPSETALALLIHERMNENSNVIPPAEVPPVPESVPVPNEDMASS